MQAPTVSKIYQNNEQKQTKRAQTPTIECRIDHLQNVPNEDSPLDQRLQNVVTNAWMVGTVNERGQTILQNRERNVGSNVVLESEQRNNNNQMQNNVGKWIKQNNVGTGRMSTNQREQRNEQGMQKQNVERMHQTQNVMCNVPKNKR